MENKKTAVFGIYTTVAAADSATDQLVRSGFSAAEVSALLPENLGTRPIGTEKATKAPEAAAAGAGSGAVLGGALGLLAGIGALAIPGVGPLIAFGGISYPGVWGKDSHLHSGMISKLDSCYTPDDTCAAWWNRRNEESSSQRLSFVFASSPRGTHVPSTPGRHKTSLPLP